MTYLFNLINWKWDSYNFTLIIIYQLIRKIYYKLIKTIIYAFRNIKVVIDMIKFNYDLLDSIVINKNLFFRSKFRSLFPYVLDIKSRSLITLYSKINN